MLMKSFLSKSSTLEEYRKVLQNRIKMLWGATFLGIGTLAVTVILTQGKILEGHDAAFVQGMFTGIGTGLVLCGAIFALRDKKILKDEQKLRQKWLKEQDERNIAITQKAVFYTFGLGMLLIFCYLLVSSLFFFSRAVFTTLYVVVIGMFLLFVVISKILEKQM